MRPGEPQKAGNPLPVTIVIPLYNKEAFVERAIESVLRQTHPDFELVVVDDGSTDRSGTKADAIRDPRVRVVRQENVGVSEARNSGVRVGQFEFIAFLDADDCWEPECLATLCDLIRTFPGCGLFGVNQWLVLGNGKVIFNGFQSLFGGEDRGILQDYFGLFARIGRSPFSSSGFAVSRRVFEEVGGYKAGVALTEDSDFWCRVALRYSVAFATKPQVTYFVETPGNTIGRYEPRDFQVSVTLQDAIDSARVPAPQRESVRELIALQQLRVIRRGIAAGDTSFVRQKASEWRFFRRYPAQALGYVTLSWLPRTVVRALYRAVRQLRST